VGANRDQTAGGSRPGAKLYTRRHTATQKRSKLVCKVVSPSTAARGRVTKRNLYARSGAAHYWLIDPEATPMIAKTSRASFHCLVSDLSARQAFAQLPI
jgi:Uma2 family endonuclease